MTQAHALDGFTISIDTVREIQQGWYFPWHYEGPAAGGSKGVVVEKQSGQVFFLGSRYSLERDLAAFDSGYRFGSAMLIVTAVHDQNRAIDHLLQLGIEEVTPEFANGVEWRIPRRLTAEEIRSRLAQLPSRLGPLWVYPAVETLEAMRQSGDISYSLEATVP